MFIDLVAVKFLSVTLPLCYLCSVLDVRWCLDVVFNC